MPENFFSHIDIAPTILSMAGVPIQKKMNGINLMDLIQNKIPERKEFFYQHYFLGGPQIPRVEGVVTPDFKYMNYVETGSEQLFDTKHDPHEIENLIKDPQYKFKLKELRNRYHDLKEKHAVPEKTWQKIKRNF